MTTLPEEAVKAAYSAYVTFIEEGGSVPVIDAVRAALTAAVPHLAAVRVKAMDTWTKAAKGNTQYLVSVTVAGDYTIALWPDNNFRLSSSHQSGWVWYETLEAAKASAQADYEARILSALEPSAARELALEEAAKIAFDISENGEYHGEASVDSTSSIYQQGAFEVYEAIRALSSPDHADAGKVEGDGWLPMTHPSLPKKGRFLAVATGEIERIAWNDPAVVVTVRAFDGPFVCYVHEDGPGFTDEFGEVYRADGVVIDAEDLTAADDVLRLTRWRPLPSAPASEGAE